VEALLAGALEPVPPPLADLVEPDLAAALPPDVVSDVGALLRLLPEADLYLQDEVQLALHPTLTRLWCRRGRRGQRLVEAPGANEKVYGFGLVDWRDGWFDGRLEPGRTAVGFCTQVRAAVAHTPAGSTLVRAMVAELGGDLHLVYTPPYDPDSNRIEWLWRITRRVVTHNHQHPDLAALEAAARAHFADLAAHPAEVLAHLGSPGFTLEDDHDALPLAA
jgi:hypothetical protein